jgi:hypothetical protein
LIQCCKTIRLTEGKTRKEEKEINKEGKTERKRSGGRALGIHAPERKIPPKHCPRYGNH